MRRAVAVAVVLTVLAAPGVAALATSLKATRVLTEGTQPGAAFLGVTGEGVTVAVLDTGVDDAHPSLAGAYVTGVDLSSGVVPPPALWSNPADNDGHGTHVANILLGRGGGGASRGVAPGARLVDVKVSSDVASLSLGGLEAGLQWVLDYNAGYPAYPIHVVSLSLGTLTPGEDDDAIAALVEDLATSGVVVVAAAGNCGPGGSVTCTERGDADTITSPGSAPAAITVAALDDRRTADRADDAVAAFSSRGPGGASSFASPKPDVAAPGKDVVSADAGGGTATLSGTSQATPHVSGVVALMLQAKPGLTPGQAKAILAATASHPTAWDAATGYGEVDAYEAVRHAKGPPYNAAPVASAAASATTVEAGTRVVFSANASRDPDGLTLSYVWSLAGRPDATGPWTAYVLDAPGDAEVHLVVTDADGAASEAVAHVTVLAPPDETPDEPPPEEGPPEEGPPPADTAPPVAAFTVTPPSPLVGEEATFDAGASTDDRGVATYAWDFNGDGLPEAGGPTATRAFPTPGVVLVALEVTDAAGNAARTEQSVVVTAPPDEAPADASPPVVKVFRPAPGARLVAPVRVEWASTDDVGVVRTSIVVDGAASDVPPIGARDLDLAPGAREVRIDAEDAAGKRASARVAFLVVAPEVPDEASDGGNGSPGLGAVLVLAAAGVALARRRR